MGNLRVLTALFPEMRLFHCDKPSLVSSGYSHLNSHELRLSRYASQQWYNMLRTETPCYRAKFSQRYPLMVAAEREDYSNRDSYPHTTDEEAAKKRTCSDCSVRASRDPHYSKSQSNC